MKLVNLICLVITIACFILIILAIIGYTIWTIIN